MAGANGPPYFEDRSEARTVDAEGTLAYFLRLNASSSFFIMRLAKLVLRSRRLILLSPTVHLLLGDCLLL